MLPHPTPHTRDNLPVAPCSGKGLMEQKLVSSLRSTLQTPACNWHACSKGSSAPPPHLCVCGFQGFFFPAIMKLRKPPKKCWLDGQNESPVPSQNSNCGWCRVGWERGWGLSSWECSGSFPGSRFYDPVFMPRWITQHPGELCVSPALCQTPMESNQGHRPCPSKNLLSSGF